MNNPIVKLDLDSIIQCWFGLWTKSTCSLFLSVAFNRIGFPFPTVYDCVSWQKPRIEIHQSPHIHYTCQFSRLRRESHSCGPISHALLKNVSCCRLAWHNFQKYVNSDPKRKERKPCVKWINDNTFLAISDFVDKRFLDNFAFGRLRTSSEDFGLLRESSEMIVSSAKIPALPG